MALPPLPHNASGESSHSFHPLQTSTGPLLGCDAVGQWGVTMLLGGQGPFRLSFDTGSSTLGVISTLCDSSRSNFGTKFNPAINATDLHESTTVTCGDGSSYTGEIYRTPVALVKNYGTAQTGPNVTTNVVAMTTQNNFLSKYSCPSDTITSTDFRQGIVGFAFPYLNTGQGDTDWVSQYFAQYPNVSAEFTYQLCPIDDGQLWVGYYNPAATTTGGVFQCASVVGPATGLGRAVE